MEKLKEKIINMNFNQKKSLVKVWGDHNFNFSLQTQTNYEYLASNLVAEAFEQNRVPIAIQCTWKRLRGKRTYKMSEIKGNTYPLSADDVGWVIRVEAKALEDDYAGTAFAEFGPVTVEPATKKSLEYILGSGSSQFPVSIYYPGDRNKLPEERETDDGTLIVYVDKLKLIKKHKNKNVFDLKYTVDCPKLEISQVDSQMLHISFFDQNEGYVGEKGFTQSIDIRALTRKSRDLIVLSIRWFAALNNYKNSKVISMLNQDEEEKTDFTKLEISSISDLLIEIDSIKRELYYQIESNKVIKMEVQKHKKQLKDMEAEMEATIQGYCEVLESQQVESNGDSFRVKQQLVDTQNANEKLKMENDALKEQLLLSNDENTSLMKKVESHEQTIGKLNKKIHKYKNQNGVPHSQVKKLEDALEQAKGEIQRLQSIIAKFENISVADKKMVQQLELEKSQLTNYLSRKEKDENKYKKALKERQKAEK